jgi:biotin carboxyl carrier protein
MQSIINNKTFNVTTANDQYFLNGNLANLHFVKTEPNKYSAIYNNQPYAIEVLNMNMDDATCQIKINNQVVDIQTKDEMAILLDKLGFSKGISKKANDLKAPMPGLLLKLLVQEGQEVKKGDSLLVLEAMKMENVLKASNDLVIKKINFKTGQTVEKGQLLIEFN